MALQWLVDVERAGSGSIAEFFKTWLRRALANFLPAGCAVAAIISAHAQGPGSLDLSFNPRFTVPEGRGFGVDALATQADGKVLIGGGFGLVNSNVILNCIARLNSDGSLDTSFGAGTGADSSVEVIVTQTNGKMLIGGYFNQFNGTTRTYIARLNSNGSLDTTFASGVNDAIFSIVEQPNGEILIGGQFTHVDGIQRTGVARLNTDGSLDTSFNAGLQQGSPDVILQSDGKILLAGSFIDANGGYHVMGRLNLNGSLDRTFDPNFVNEDDIRSVAVTANGTIVVAGNFQDSGVVEEKVIRLNADGGTDASFHPATIEGFIYALVIQSDGKMLIGGYFSEVDGVARSGIARLNADGSLDTGFNPGSGVDVYVNSIALQSNGEVVIGGAFNAVNGVGYAI